MKIIDFRVRPPLKGILKTAMYANAPRRDRFTRQLGMEPAPAAFPRPDSHRPPDMYLYNMPGMDDWLKAANGWPADRFIYASAYPLTPLQEDADWFARLRVQPGVVEKCVYKNAAGLLGI